MNPLPGVMSGLANTVNEHLMRLTIGAQATRFLRHLERLTFGSAGWHRRAGRNDPGLWCPYDHARWAEALHMSASALSHLRVRLKESSIIWYTPNPDRRGHGAVGWNTDFAAWTPPQWGGPRVGAGRPRGCPQGEHTAISMGQSDDVGTAARNARQKPIGASDHVEGTCPLTNVTFDADAPIFCGAVLEIQDVNDNEAGAPHREIKMSTGGIQDVNQIESRCQRTPCKMSTASRAEPAPGQAPVPRVRKNKKKQEPERRKTDADASGVSSTPVAAPAATDAPYSISVPHAASAISDDRSTAQPFPQGPPAALGAHAGDALPPRLPYETLGVYWLRIFREASAATGKEPQYLVHAAAQRLLGMGHERADYVVLGQLRHTAGSWATVLHWILDCAGRELADPRTYLRAIARRHRDESDQASARSRRARSARPVGHQSAERSRRSAWVPVDPRVEAGAPAQEQGSASAHMFPMAEPPRGSYAPSRSSLAPASIGAAESDLDESDVEAAQPRTRHESGATRPSVPDDALRTPYLPVSPIWHAARQRLRAELPPAQYDTWLAATELLRAADGTFVLTTRTTFAAELVANRYGERIREEVQRIVGSSCTLTIVPRMAIGEGVGR